MARGAAPKRQRPSERGLPVYVCEYHDEALRCLHHGIRRRRVPFEGLALVHLDAHPDLGASAGVPADTVFTSPHDVYAGLRADPGGIAQWILPAVYGGHLNCVWWVRPSWATQIADGGYRVEVGRARRRPCGAPSLGASVRAAAPPVANCKPVGGVAAGASNCGGDAERPPLPECQGGGGAATGLDAQGESVEPPETLCVSCSEPYFVEDGIYLPGHELAAAKPLHLLVSQLPLAGDGEQHLADAAQGGQGWVLDVCLDYFACGNPFLRQTRPHIAAAFAAAQEGAAFRRGPVEDVAGFLKARDAFDRAYNNLLVEALSEDQGGEHNNDDDDAALEAAVEALGGQLSASSRSSMVDALRTALEEARDSELQEIQEAGDMVTLPLHAGEEAELRERLAAFDCFVARMCALRRPVAVTIARSVVDGFCPMRWNGMLEYEVLKVVRSHLGTLDILYNDEVDMTENM